MSSIPLDLQRRFERRWAARFLRSNPPTAPKSISLKSRINSGSRFARAKEKPSHQQNGPSGADC
jgi:hypothetical protein